MLDAGGCVVAPGLVDLHTHLRSPARRRPRPSRPAAGPRRSAASPRSSPCPTPTPAIDSAARGPRGARARRARRCATCTPPAPSPSAGRASSWRRWPRWPRSACGSSPTTARRAGQPAHAPGAGVRRRASAGRRSPSTARTTRSAGGGHMHEGEWSSRLGIPGQPAEAEELMVDPRHRAGPPHRRPRPLPAPVDRRLGRAGAGGQGRRACRSPPRRHRTTSRSPTPSCASYDPVFKVNPPLRTDADVAAVQGGPGRRHHRRHRHRPRARTPRRPRSSPSTRRRPGMLGLETALALALTELDLPVEQVARPAVVAAGGHRRPRRRATAARSPRAARQPVRDRPHRRRGPSTPPRSASRSRNTPVRRPHAHRPGAPHDPAGRARRHRRRGAAMSAIREALLVLADGTTFEGEAIGAEPPGGDRHRRGRVQHRADRLPGGASPTRPTPGRSSPSPTRTSATTA